jgi:hypothetical protein
VSVQTRASGNKRVSQLGKGGGASTGSGASGASGGATGAGSGATGAGITTGGASGGGIGIVGAASGAGGGSIVAGCTSVPESIASVRPCSSQAGTHRVDSRRVVSSVVDFMVLLCFGVQMRE